MDRWDWSLHVHHLQQRASRHVAPSREVEGIEDRGGDVEQVCTDGVCSGLKGGSSSHKDTKLAVIVVEYRAIIVTWL